MKLSREKVLQLSHLVLNYFNSDDAIEYFVDPQELRQQVVRLIGDEMKADESIDQNVRRKIESQKRGIIEGTEEWDVLYRKYYEEETARHRRVAN